MSRPVHAQTQSARAALVAALAGAALALAAGRPVALLVVVAVLQVAFVLAWVLGSAVAVEPGESFDGPDEVVELGPTPALLGSSSAAASSAPSDVEARVTATADPVPGSGGTQTAAARGPDRLDQEPSGPAAGAMPGRIGAVLIGAGTAAVTDYAVMHWPHSELSPMLGILGLAIPVMFAHQLIRGVVRARVVESLSGIAMIIAAVLALPALIQLRHEAGGGYLVAGTALAAGLAVVVGILVDLVWSRPRFDPNVPRGLTGVVLAAVAGGVVGAYPLRHQDQFSTGRAVAYCAGIALVSALVSVATSMVGHSAPASPLTGRARALRPVALALLPIMFVAPAAYVVLVSA